MIRLCQKFLLYLAAATDRQLVSQIEYLRAENRILRSKLPKRVKVTPRERNWLVKLGKAVGSAVKHLGQELHHDVCRHTAGAEPFDPRSRRQVHG